MQTIVRVLPKGQITIPQKIRRELNLKENSILEVEKTKQGVLLKPASKKIELRSLKTIRKDWARYQDEIGDALDKLKSRPKSSWPKLLR